MGIEIELRARFDQVKHDQLLEYLTQQAEDLGENNKQIYFYVFPDKLLKIVSNLSAGTAKISLKSSKIGQGIAFPELEMEIPVAEVSTAVRIFSGLGFADLMHDAFNQRHDFRYRGVEVALKYSEAWGYHAEFEVLLADTAGEVEQAEAVTRIHQVADELGVRIMTEQELLTFTEEFERQQASKT